MEKISMTTEYANIKDNYSWDELYREYGNPNIEMIMQLPDEFYCLLKLYIDKSPENTLEIGTSFGGTLYYWLKYAPDISKIISLDISHDALGFSYEKWNINYDNLTLITADSSNIKTYAKVRSICSGFDFIFIDGNHQSPYPLNDFLMYSNLINNGGTIVMHDIQGSMCGNGARDAWKYIEESGYKTQKFIHSNLVDFGIGVVYF